MGRARRLGAALLLSLAAAGCSVPYALQSAAGHLDLLRRRRSIDSALADPDTPMALRGPLITAQSARRFAFERLGMKRTRDFSSYSPIDRSAVTYLVSGSRRAKLQAYEWSFPFVGKFPYKGYFKKSRALAERDRLEKAGWDAWIGGAAAYKTPLPFADPLPSPALKLSTGALAGLLIHELAHGTVYFKSQGDFDESFAQFAGEEGARRYLAARFGAGSAEALAYETELEADASADAVFARLRRDLEALYSGPGSDGDKLEKRRPLFSAAEKELTDLGYDYGPLNNAVVVAHGVYHADLPFAEALARCGGDYKRFIASMRALDRRDPAADLKRRAAPGAACPG